jgi:pimeloyl-ACP methyl ester carboxylesterase
VSHFDHCCRRDTWVPSSRLLGQITQPALIVHGEADQPISLPLGQALRDGLPGPWT